MSFIKLIRKDLKKYVPSGNSTTVLKIILINHSFHLVLWIRVGQAIRTIPFIGGVLGILVEYFIRVFFASDISCKAQIEGGLMIVHGHDVVIGSDVIIGENCKIFNGVTLGSKDTESMMNFQPKIGNNVVIGTGCKILGGIEIGDNVKAGANSVILTDIPNNCIAVGVPARVVR